MRTENNKKNNNFEFKSKSKTIKTKLKRTKLISKRLGTQAFK